MAHSSNTMACMYTACPPYNLYVYIQRQCNKTLQQQFGAWIFHVELCGLRMPLDFINDIEPGLTSNICLLFTGWFLKTITIDENHSIWLLRTLYSASRTPSLFSCTPSTWMFVVGVFCLFFVPLDWLLDGWQFTICLGWTQPRLHAAMHVPLLSQAIFMACHSSQSHRTHIPFDKTWWKKRGNKTHKTNTTSELCESSMNILYGFACHCFVVVVASSFLLHIHCTVNS